MLADAGVGPTQFIENTDAGVGPTQFIENNKIELQIGRYEPLDVPFRGYKSLSKKIHPDRLQKIVGH